MKILATHLAVFVFTIGDVALQNIEFQNIYNGDNEMPKNLDLAVEGGWINVERDERLRIHWYSHEENPVQLAYDGLKGLSGVRLVIPKKEEKEFYTKSKVFEERTINDKAYYVATVLLTDPVILERTENGREKTEADEIVETIQVKLKTAGQDGIATERVLREACDNADRGVFLEQGCNNNYGLVFAPLKKENENCDYPVFFVYNVVKRGEMLGFGWIAPSADLAGSKALTDNDINILFPSKPECLKGKTTVNIWLAKYAKKGIKCVPQGKFVEENCKPARAL